MNLKTLVIINNCESFQVGVIVGKTIEHSVNKELSSVYLVQPFSTSTRLEPSRYEEGSITEILSLETPTWLKDSYSYKEAIAFQSSLNNKETTK
jgi:hypothetical protein